MPRIQFSDVVPPEKKSIRDIPIPNSGNRKQPVVIKPEITPSPKTDPKIETVVPKKNDTYEYYYPKDKDNVENPNPLKNKPKKKIIFGGLAFILIAVFIISMMTIFASATIVITPKTEQIEVNTKINALNTTDEDLNTVGYEIIKLSAQKSLPLEATGEEEVEIKASGKIVVYNNFSYDPQRLIIRTRFESPEGLVYRIPESIVVPSKKIVAGVETPGSIEVTVFADEAGEKYNIKKTDFTIPGFKTDAGRYKNFYARSVTDMEGGFIGKMKIVSKEQETTALQNLNLEIETNLEKDLQSKIPAGLILLKNSIIYESSLLPKKEEGSSVVIGKEVTAYAIMLNEKDLSNRLISEYIGNKLDWENIKSIIKDFSLLNISEKPNKFDNSQKIELLLVGKIQVLADIDTDLISQKIIGKPKKEAGKLIDEFAGIKSITATIRPMWKRSFPENPSKIHVESGVK